MNTKNFENVRKVAVIIVPIAWMILLYMVCRDAIFHEMRLIPVEMVEICFVSLFCGLVGSAALFSVLNPLRFSMLERSCLVFIFFVSFTYLFAKHPQLFLALPF